MIIVYCTNGIVVLRLHIMHIRKIKNTVIAMLRNISAFWPVYYAGTMDVEDICSM